MLNSQSSKLKIKLDKGFKDNVNLINLAMVNNGAKNPNTLKKLEKDKEKEIKQNSNSVFSLDARLDVIELKYAERFNIYNNELQHLKDKLKLINYCINVVFY